MAINFLNNPKVGDNTKIEIGTGSDLQIYHDGNSKIETSTSSAGDLFITAQGSGHDLYLQAADDIFIRPQAGENGVVIVGNAEVKLYYNNVVKFETSSTGVTVPGTVNTGGGNSATPAIIFEGDTNTGFFHPAADTIGFSTAGLERIRILSTGNIAIGTTTASSKLTVQDNSYQVMLVDTSTSNRGEISVEDAAFGFYADRAASTADSSFFWSIDNLNKMEINLTGGGEGQLRLNDYGPGNITGTVEFILGVDANGNVIETSAGGSGTVTGTGAATRVAFWSGTTALSSDANLYWDNTNDRLGIGTTAPAEKLQVAGSIKSTSRAISGSATAGVTLSYDTTNSIAKIETWTSKPFSIETAGAERMRITSAGNVGINTTNPGAKLQVSGGVLLGSTYAQPSGSTWTTANSQLILGGAHNAEFNTGTKVKLLISGYDNDGTSTIYPIYLQDENGLDDFWIKNRQGQSAFPTMYFAGNVGIGTTSPSAKAVISNGGALGYEIDPASASGEVLSLFSYNRSTSAWKTTRYSALDHRFETNGTTERMRITSAGKLGIGTTNPLANLDISNTAGGVYQQWSYDNPGSNNYNLQLSETVTSGNVRFVFDQKNGGTQYSDVLVFNQGKIGIGTDEPTEKLTVSGNIHLAANQSYISFNTSASTGHPKIKMESDGDFSFLNTAGSSSMRIENGGNVGIGTTAPGTKLDVLGASLGTAINNTATQARFRAGVANNSQIYIQDYRTSAGTDWTTSGKRIQMQVDSTWMGWMQFNGYGNSSGVSWGTGATTTQSNVPERMRLTSVGDLGIGTTAPGEKLEVVGNSITRSKTRGIGTNYATSEGWVESSAVASATGFFGGNFSANGGSSENKVEFANGPFGSRELVWMSIPETGNNDDGGWNKGMDGFSSSSNNGFMSVIYVRRDSGTPSGNFYHGCSQQATENLGGSANTNPYFSAVGISTFPADVWCIAIGIIYANNDSSTVTSTLGGIYRLDTGQKISAATTFRQKASNATQVQRVYHYYSTSPTAQLDFAKPGFYIVDGSEPSLSELLNGGATDDAFWSASGNDIYNDNSGNVGIGTTSPSMALHVSRGGSTLSGIGIGQTGTGSSRVYMDASNGDFSGGDYMQMGQNNDLSGDIQMEPGAGAFNIKTGTGSPTRFTVLQNGNVGIGTTSPAYALDVNNSARLGASGNGSNPPHKTIISGQSISSDGVNYYGSYGFLELNATSNWTGSARRFAITNALDANKFAIIRSDSNMATMQMGASGAVPTGATADFVITNTGTVGIGTSSPSGQLDVSGDIWVNGDNVDSARYLRINRGGTSDGGILLYGNGSLDWQLVNNSSTRDLLFYSYAASSTVVRIQASTGNVGIGTTAPAATLDVGLPTGVGGTAGSVNRLHIAPFSNTGGPYKFIARTVSGSSDFLDMYYGSNHIISYSLNGDVGIGTTAPAVKLQVSTNSPTNNVAAVIGGAWVGNSNYHKEGGLLLISGTSQDATQTGAGIAFQTRNTQNSNYWKSSVIMDRDGAMRFTLGGAGTVAGSEDFTILSNGNVGIGTTAPTYGKLVLSSTIASTSDYNWLVFNNAQSGYGDWNIHKSGNNDLAFASGVSAGDSYTNRLVLEYDGNVGIGVTDPLQKLHLQNGILLIDTSTATSSGIWMPDTAGNPSFRIVTDQSTANFSSIVNAWGNSSNTGLMVGTIRNDGIAFQVRSGVTITDGFADDSGTTRMTVLGGGNVGIGVTSPTNYKLEVAGTVEGDAFSVDGISSRIFAPSGATYNGANTQTGYLIAKLPDLGTAGLNNMMTGVIRVYDYAYHESFDIHFAGYWYSGYNWTNPTAWIESAAYSDRNFTVRFGRMTGAAGANTRAFITIGEATSTWTYCKFSLINYEPGHSNYQAYKWDSGWDMDISATYPGSTMVSVSNTQINNWARSGANVYFASANGKVGIGETNPQQKLHVDGRGLFETGGSIPDSTTGTYEKGITLTGGNQRLVIDVSSASNGGSYIQTRHQSTSFPTAEYSLALNPLGGDVGVGVAAPGAKLHVAAASEVLRIESTSATGSPFISFFQTTTRRSYIYHNNNNTLELASEYGGIRFLTGTGGTETQKMVIQSNGTVGIGTTNPVNPLQVTGKIYSSTDIQAAGQLQGTDLKLDPSSSSTSDLNSPTGFIDVEVDGGNYIIPYFTAE